MKYMIDTHILLWWLDSPDKISLKARSIIENPENIVFVSVACNWEIVIKKSIGKLQAPDNLMEILIEESFTSLPITSKHVLELSELPTIHQDPFDRIQIAQSRIENLIFITRDENISNYNLQCIKG